MARTLPSIVHNSYRMPLDHIQGAFGPNLPRVATFLIQDICGHSKMRTLLSIEFVHDQLPEDSIFWVNCMQKSQTEGSGLILVTFTRPVLVYLLVDILFLHLISSKHWKFMVHNLSLNWDLVMLGKWILMVCSSRSWIVMDKPMNFIPCSGYEPSGGHKALGRPSLFFIHW